MERLRKPFQGVLNILSFNRHFYLAGLLVLVLLFVSRHFVVWPDILFYFVIAGIGYGLLMPLLVSAYVYDFSGYYEFDWLNNVVKNDRDIKLVANINAGFDETSFILKKKFQQAGLRVFDFYDAKQHTETAIKRARKVSMIYPGTQQIQTTTIPLNDNSADLVFLLSAAHEIRSHKEKVQFLKECHRICKQNGKVIMVEHLRDVSNFLAFTIGFTHFFSRREWKKAFAEAGFNTCNEKKFTAFMSIFECAPTNKHDLKINPAN